MRTEVVELSKLGPLPASDKPRVALVKKFQDLITSIESPVSDEEARVLVTLFGPDECFGLAWALLHLIESAPGWPIADSLESSSGEWIDQLKQRLRNAGKKW